MLKTLGKKKLIKDISANTLQTVITQVFGLFIFYLTSRYLAKDNFGEFNWSMAVGSTIIAVASLGLDLVFVRKVAQGKDIVLISSIHFFHTVLIGVSLGLIVLVVKMFVPAFNQSHPLFFFIFLNLALANIANSFKLCLNGLEAYKRLAIISLFTNTFKFLCILALYLINYFTITNVILAYLLSSALELVIAYFMMSKSISTRIKPLLKVEEYKYFILESLPQLGVVLFDSALARVDWILLGIISTAAATAEYSFTYKIFELAKFPLLIIAPVLLTRFSKLFNNEAQLSVKHKEEIQFLLKLEMFAMMFIPIILVSCWTPLIDFFTDGKYGAVNEVNFIILAFCVPIHAIINFLWTLGFVQGQLKTILIVTVIVSLLNILANAVLIPYWGSLGSSLAFLFCTIIQALLYLRFIKQTQIKLEFKNIGISFLIAVIAIVSTKILINYVIFGTLIAVLIHVVLTFVTGQITISRLKQIVWKGQN